jgi:hypothetical protein
MLDDRDRYTWGALSTGAETASCRLNGCAAGVGQDDEVRHRVAGAAADLTVSALGIGTAGGGQQDLGPNDLDGRCDSRATDLRQLLLLLPGELAEPAFDRDMRPPWRAEPLIIHGRATLGPRQVI